MLRASSRRIHEVEVLGGDVRENNTLAYYFHVRPLLNPPLSLLRLDAKNSET